MNTATHTPGPWRVDECEDAYGNATIRREDGTKNGDTERPVIATVYDDPAATLIAAAPELLEACKIILNAGVDYGLTWSECCDKVRDAIAKAGGSQ